MPDFSKEQKIVWSLLQKTDVSLAAYGSDSSEAVNDYVNGCSNGCNLGKAGLH